MTELPKREEVTRSLDQLVADLRTLGLHAHADRIEAERRAKREAKRPNLEAGARDD
jgi:hypothetical protein